MTITTEQQQPARAQIKQSLSTQMLQEFVVPSGSQPYDVAPAPGQPVNVNFFFQ
jgi:streptogramin lyase